MQPNYPAQYPQQPAPQGYPAQPAPAYPQQPYAQPQAPVYPPQPAYPQGYAQPQYPAQPPAPMAPPPPPGTLDGFFDQPSASGGPSFKFNGKPIGTNYAGIVARPVSDSDVRHQTNQAGVPQTYKDGRPKLVMVVPMQVQPSPEFPEGVAGWWVKGQARDELARAMAEAGAPVGAPEAGAAIRVTLVGQRPVPNMNPAYQYRVEYVRPNGAAPVAAPQPAAQPVQAPAVQQVLQPAPMPQPAPQPVASTSQAMPLVGAPAPQPVPQPIQAAAPAGFDADQAALFAKLTGQPVG